MTRRSDARSDLPPYTGTLEPAHLAVVAAERDRWLRIGLSTTPADRPAAEAAVHHAYTARNLKPPGVVWMDSPLGGCLAVATISQAGEQSWDQLKGQLPAQFRDQLADQPMGGLTSRVSGLIWGQYWDWLWFQLADQLRFRLGRQRWDQLKAQLWEQLGDQLGDQRWFRLRDQLVRQVHEQLPGQLRNHVSDHLDTWSLMFKFARYHCALRIAGLPPAPRLEALADAVASVGWWWPLRGVAVLTDRPTCIVPPDADGELHTDTDLGPALAWADGYRLHALHGVRVPAHGPSRPPPAGRGTTGTTSPASWWRRLRREAPQTLTVDQIHREENAEVRRVMLERYGHRRFLRDAHAERVHTDQFGTLWRCPVPDDEELLEELLMVEVTNATPEPDGSRRTYWLRVPPDMHTARHAVAWTFGLPAHDYAPAVES
jgi:hypothetical protein